MAPVDTSSLASQLKKLTKDELIQIIITKSVESVTTLNQQTLDQLNSHLSGKESRDKQENLFEGLLGDTESDEGVTGHRLLGETLRHMKAELELSQRMNAQLEDRIGEQSMFISILKSNFSTKGGKLKIPQVVTPTNLTTSSGGQFKSKSGLQKKSDLDGGAESKGCDCDAALVGSSPSATKSSSLRKHEAATAAKYSEIVNLVNFAGVPPTPTEVAMPNGRKNYGKGKRSHQHIIGEREVVENGTCGIRAATTYKFFHVTKLHPETTAEELAKFLKSDLPKVRVEKLDSLHPESYSSFKIAVSEANEKKILNPSLWPSGCRINRFFHARKKPTD